MHNYKSLFAIPAALVTAMALSLLSPAFAAGNLDGDPYTVLKTSSDELISTIKRDKEKLQANPEAVYGVVRDIIEPALDVPYMTALILGRHYRDSSSEQRKAFAETFSNQMIRRYADALLEYSNEEVTYKKVKVGPNDDKVKVDSSIVPKSGVPVPLVYSMRKGKSDKRWKIYDVSIDGISMITNYRSQFDSLISKKGLDGVIADLKN